MRSYIQYSLHHGDYRYAGVLIHMVGNVLHLVLILWAIAFLIVVPAGLSSLIKARKEAWQVISIGTA